MEWKRRHEKRALRTKLFNFILCKLVLVEVNLTVIITVYGLKFHVFNFPFSNFNGKPKTIDTNGDDRKERPLNAVAEELECVAVELDAVTADYGVFRIPFDETNFSSCKTEQYEESTYCDKSELHNAHRRTFCANATYNNNESNSRTNHDTNDKEHNDPSTDKVEQATGEYAVIYLRLLEFFCLCHLFASFTPIACAKSVILNFYGTAIIQHKKVFVNKKTENFFIFLKKSCYIPIYMRMRVGA